jgi:adenosylmethionine-8-amino-7-oxononanoate aminotransferase
MYSVDPAMQQTFADNVWLHFFQMGHSSSTSARPTTILVRGEGSRVWDQEGKQYIDALAGLFCVNAGYGRREIVEAVAAQMLDIAFVSPFTFPSLPQIKLAGELARISPLGPKTRTFFTAGGSDAVEAALKLAKSYQSRRGFTNRHKTISRRVAYHGTTMGALSVNGLPGVRNGFGPLVPGARHVPLPHRYRCDYCALAARCSGVCADEVERLIEFEGPETIAAIIMEPVQNSGGAIVPPPGYLERVRQICDHYGIVMIADEVICGFGRVGAWFGSEALGVAPDIMTCAKGITSGYAPLGAVMVRPEIADAFIGAEGDKFMHGVTFGGHPASCAAALANLAIIEREGLNERSRSMGDYMIRELRAAVAEHPNVGDIRGMGLFMALELVDNQENKAPLEEPNLMGWLSDQFKRRGLICRADDRLDPVVQLAPPLNIPREDADQVVTIVADVIQALGRKLGTQPTMRAVGAAIPRAPEAIAVG